MFSKSTRIPAALFGLLLVSRLMYAQAGGTARIYGLVHDSSGAVIPAVAVTAHNHETDIERQTVTTGAGDYVLPNLPVGTYSVTITKPGFETFETAKMKLQVDQSIRVDATMKVGSVSQRTTVMVQAEQLETKSATLKDVVGQKRMVDLPLNGRNVLELTVLVPGVVPTGGTEINQAYTNPTQQFVSPSGGRGNTTLYILDGTDNSDIYTNVASVFPNPDALQEFSFQTNNFSAEYGSRSGGVVNAVTRSGTNQLHGSAFAFHRDFALNATNFFTPGTNDGLIRNQFGTTVGGPILKDKLFFFGSWQGTISHQSPLSSSTVPTAEQRKGDFSQLRSGAGLVTIRDPATGQPFANNQIPASQLDPVGQKLLSSIPLPTGANGLVRFNYRDFRHDDQAIGKIDYSPSTHDTLSFRYLYDTLRRANPIIGQNLLTGNFFPDFQSHNIAVSDTHTFSPTLVGVFSVSYNRIGTIHQPIYPFSFLDLGVQMTRLEPGNDLTFSVGGFFSVAASQYAHHVQNLFQYNGAFTKQAGKHELKFGVNAGRMQFNNPLTGFTSAGSFTFGGNFSGSNLADYMLGKAQTFTQITPWAEALRATQIGLYLQDDWRISRKLTFNLGLRWAPLLPWNDVRNSEIAKFVPGVQSTRAPGLPTGLLVVGDSRVPSGGYESSWDKFDPRFGFAYDLGHNTVMRGGFGVFHDFPNAIINNRMAVSPPFVVRVDVQNPTSMTIPFTATTPNPFPVPIPPPKGYVFPRPVLAVTYGDNYTNAYAMEWNYTIEHQLFPDWLVRASYMGSRGLHLQQERELDPGIYIPGASTTANINQRRPYGPDFTSISALESVGTASYNAFALSLNKRFSRDFTVNASYTFSKSTDIQSAKVSQGGAQISNSFNAALDHGLSDFDATHRFVASFVWQLPGPVQARGFMLRALGGWQLNGIVTFQSGTPFTVVDGTDQSVDGVGGDRPNLIAGPSLDAGRAKGALLARYFNTAAFQLNPVGTFGTAGRNVLRGPGVANSDLSLFKHFKITERIQAQLRGEFFNAFNRTPLSNPNASLNSAQFGQVLSAGSPRILQLGARVIF